MDTKAKREKHKRRHKRVRAKIFGTKERPRLCVFRSAKHIYCQLIDDDNGKTLVMASDRELKQKTKNKKRNTKEEKKEVRTGKVALAYEIGKLIAEKALEKKIEKVVFDRGGYKYHGRIKALAEGAREGGLKF